MRYIGDNFYSQLRKKSKSYEIYETHGIWWYKHIRHTTTTKYDNSGQVWCFRFDYDNKMSYKYILPTTWTWMGQFNTYIPTYCEKK